MTTTPEPAAHESHWTSEAAAPTPGHRPRRRSMAELADLELTADAILERQNQPAPLAVATLDHDKIWANFREGKGTPTAASTLVQPEIDRAEIERRLKR